MLPPIKSFTHFRHEYFTPLCDSMLAAVSLPPCICRPPLRGWPPLMMRHFGIDGEDFGCHDNLNTFSSYITINDDFATRHFISLLIDYCRLDAVTVTKPAQLFIIWAFRMARRHDMPSSAGHFAYIIITNTHFRRWRISFYQGYVEFRFDIKHFITLLPFARAAIVYASWRI